MKNELTNYQQLAEQWLVNQHPALTQQQMQQFIMFCKMYQLNPWKNEAYPIVYSGKLQLVTNYLVLCARAKQNPKYYREDITYWQDGKQLQHPHLTPAMRGVVVCVNIYDNLGNLISNYDFDVDENSQANHGSFKNNYFASWVQKCAITNALRRTFPNEIAGLYIPEEFNATETTIKVEQPQPAPIQQTQPVIEVKKEVEEKVVEPQPEPKKQPRKSSKPSAKFNKVYKALKELEPNQTARLNVLTTFCKVQHIPNTDLRDGNFDEEAFMKFLKQTYEPVQHEEDGINFEELENEEH